MKKLFLILIIVIISGIQISYGQSKNSKEEINVTIDNYLKGQRTDNPELIKSVFTEDASLKFISVRDNSYRIIPIKRYLTFFNNKRNRTFKEKLFYINVEGTAANVKLEIKYETFKYTHYFNMLKTREGWKIVNKISSQENFKK